MDNSWQNTCSSNWQATTVSAGAKEEIMAAPVNPQPSMNHLERNAGQYLYPHVVQESRSTYQGRLRETAFQNTLSLGSYKFDRSEMGNSFLAFLSGSPMLQCNIQHMSNQKPLNNCYTLPINSNSAVNRSPGSRVPLVATGPGLDTMSKQKQKKRNVSAGGFSSNAALSTNQSSTTGFPHGLPDSNLPNVDKARAVIHHTVSGTGKVRGNSSFPGEWDSAAKSTNSVKQQLSIFEYSQKMSTEKSFSSFHRSSNFIDGFPRVLCLSICGDLLLSNTGLLAVVCSCHCLHMSISKFCEHSGSHDVNPGDAVHMENGKTIAQWRKLYFKKIGIRVPDDQSGWNWPECFSANAGLVKSSLTIPNSSNNTDCYNLIGGSPGRSVRPIKPQDNILLSENSVTDQNHRNGLLPTKQINDDGNRNVPFKRLIGASYSKAHGVTDSQSPTCSRMLNSAGRGISNDACETISAHKESISKGENSCISQTTLQNLRNPSTVSNLKKVCNLKEVINLDQDVVSSNIELRLGQPYQQSWSSGSALQMVVGPKPLDSLGDPPKSVSRDHLIHKEQNFSVVKKCNQYSLSLPDAIDFSSKRELNQSTFFNHTSVANNAVDMAILETFKEDATNSSVISMLLSHINATSGENVHSRGNHNIHNTNEHSIHGTVQYQSLLAKPCPINFPSNSGRLERHINVKECLTNSSHFSVEPDKNLRNPMENSNLLNGVAGGSSNPSVTAVNDRNFNTGHFYGMPLDVSCSPNFFNYCGKVPSSGDLAIGTGMGFFSPQQTSLMCFPSETSTYIPNMTSALPNNEGIGISPYMMDENLRLLGVRHMQELPKQDDAISSPGIERQHGTHCSFSTGKLSTADPLCAEQLHLLSNTNKTNVTEVVQKSSKLHRMDGDVEKFASVAGLNNWCNLSTSMQGNPLCSKEPDTQGQSSHNPLPDKPHPRLVRNESIMTCNVHVKGYPRVPYACNPENCSSLLQAKSLGRDHYSKLETSGNAFNGQAGGVSCKDLLVSNIDPKQKESLFALETNRNLEGYMPKKVNFHSFQWKDVPNKVVRAVNMTHMDTANTLVGSISDDKQLEEAANICSKIIVEEVNPLKRKEISNTSSGCSTPAVIQASTQFTTTDSCTVGEGDVRYVNDLLVDEGSANDKCGSSDDVLCSDKSVEFLGSTSKSNLMMESSSNAFANDLSCNLIADLKLLDSLRWKKLPNEIVLTATSYSQSNQHHKDEVRKKCMNTDRDIKGRMLGASLIASGLCSVNNESSKPSGGPRRHSPGRIDEDVVLPSDQEPSHSLDTTSQGPKLKHKFSSTKIASRKRDLRQEYNHRAEEEDSYETNCTDSLEFCRASCIKRLRKGSPNSSKKLRLPKPNVKDSEAVAKFISAGSRKAVSIWKMNDFRWKARPVVYGKYGIILNGKEAIDISKPANIVPLSKILKTARCTLSENCEHSTKELKKKRAKVSYKTVDAFSRWGEKDCEINKANVCNGLDLDKSIEAEQKTGSNKQIDNVNELLRFNKEREARRMKRSRVSTIDCVTKPKTKETQKDNLCDLIVTGNNSRGAPPKKFRSLDMLSGSADNSKNQICEERDVSAKITIVKNTCNSSIADPGAICCVCGSLDEEEYNCLLECSQCSIRVHQACYGVAKVPKSSWCCRPCRTSSKDIACVLCGYGGGAITRALQSCNVVNGLLAAWNIEPENRVDTDHHSSEAMTDDFRLSNSFNSKLEGGEFPVVRLEILEKSSAVVLKMNTENQSEIVKNITGSSSKLKNSITAGVLDPTVTQWVHMVCGLWTPETRCPNVDTMNAFDVSGVSHSRTSVVCSICNRPGGSSIHCRVVNCPVRFHPWCAHQKGLLQSEVEGLENESVGFYGRCARHAMCPPTSYSSKPNDSESGSGRKELTCVRTEGYKGRKRDGLRDSIYSPENGIAGCFVPQEQLNAWLHINGQKSCTKGLLKQPVTDIEHDCRKEYARYKLVKGWKHLVVYKSGIHALGLYTSQFIIRNAMVVEYVGEIVGLRVADKREREYLSGRNLQYKSACYFFRIDKEHIIDATCKGGIARFVNHSCLPNCVAKVISVRNKKKVVFFAERDIYPGEEITYDYHFNHEDEGKKIPCFCNSKNCRRYMN